MKKSISSLLVPAIGSVLLPLAASAQNIPAAKADIARETSLRKPLAPVNANTNNLTPSPGEDAPKLPGDAEYGVQKVLVRRSNWEPWQGGAFAGLSYATNPALLHENAQDDFYFQGGAYAAYTPQLRGNWFADFGLGQSFYNYDKLDVLDFAQTLATVGVIYATPADAPGLFRNTVVALRYRFENLTSVDNLSDDFFTDHSIQLGLQRTFRISRGQRAYVGLAGKWSLDSSEENAARNEYTALCGYRLEWTPEFSTAFDVRTAIYDYTSADRVDWNNILSANAEYKFTEWASLSANLGWIFNVSDTSMYDYNNGNLGALVTLNVRF